MAGVSIVARVALATGVVVGRLLMTVAAPRELLMQVPGGGVLGVRMPAVQCSRQGLCAAMIVSTAVPMTGMVLSILTGILHASSLRWIRMIPSPA